ncbi:efflux RND transporter periplasmic adaptor subunit [Flavihumibacter profundi]|uniref:efflux RND transporter periplasmic adaptor subunit n=1 Tax=Flavihumibacter profundi TaxID=2716883 RepID=UPI001CC48E9D|nr:efflux RND transporter periplasmic adaptor subunit [Flavihumibacter profundi]MBZ5858452.1 efflux RND transporter periplasmic adaptor subunit [Flavihumibacter profundi]
MKNKILLPGTTLLTLISLISCQPKEPAEDKKIKEAVCVTDSMASIIQIDTAITSNINDEVKLSGEVNFNDKKVVKVYPFSSGQVIKVMVSLGDKVNAGQTLAIIKSADVAGNYSDLSAASNDLAIAKKQMDNAESLFNNGIASEREFIEAKENYSKAVSNANKIKDQININGGGHTSENGTYVITAPMNGYVVEKKINEGGFIRTDNGDNLFTIGDISDVWVWANVYETDIAKVKEGYTARVTTLAYPDSSFNGVVDKVNQILDPVTKVMKIRVRLPNPGMKLKPEMFANIAIENKESKKAVSVPEQALINDNGKVYLVIYEDKCKLSIRQVEVIKTTAGRAYLKNGIQEGEKVISKNQILFFRALTS